MIDSINPEIREIYKDLQRIEGSLSDAVDPAEIGQETLDFLAMAAGLKPVCLLGRGAGTPEWVTRAADLSRARRFYAVEGPFWDATPYGHVPGWYRDHSVAQIAPLTALYICSTRERAKEIAAVSQAGGRLSMSVEADLLGYPHCCVVAHYDRAVHYHRAILSILRRLARGQEGRMQELLRGGAALAPKTTDEIADMEAAFEILPAPYGSWNQCRYCAGNVESPSAALSNEYRALADRVDPALRHRFGAPT